MRRLFLQLLVPKLYWLPLSSSLWPRPTCPTRDLGRQLVTYIKSVFALARLIVFKVPSRFVVPPKYENLIRIRRQRRQ
ncbi:hypothetical protein B0T26DRAFT_218456 [Lasiosphaeria miniovina]|uniref:Uncharacterized protein n=1 Tax=Lasiosphaeria miniovina TaxID=1954250 RepID=A0AA40AUT3_9PEZI|nr:uncharacterized protein B0T26DRAFT_218456 [Lasiosphaeria miniovina]KAK0722417.1 hypothetical protein B0T26DRAFT_218456 [Lasiosphaeria miniovina]